MFSDPIFWLSLAIAVALGYYVRHLIVSKQVGSVEEKIKFKLEEAQTQAKGVILEAKDKAALLLEEVKKEEKEGKSQLLKFEERLIKKEEFLEKQFADIVSQKVFLEKGISDLGAKKLEIEELRKQILVELEKVARLSVEDAKKQVLDRIKQDHGIELAKALQKLEKEKREEIEKKSLDIITSAIQRYSRSHVADITTSVFQLQDEELKGKIIGREGRNIRTLERLTGVEFIIDETPDAVVISSFDPLRREVARLTLEKLVKDGRIQPAKIEEKVEEAKQELNRRIEEIGENAVLEVGVIGIP